MAQVAIKKEGEEEEKPKRFFNRVKPSVSNKNKGLLVDPKIQIFKELNEALVVKESEKDRDARLMKTRLDESCQIKFLK